MRCGCGWACAGLAAMLLPMALLPAMRALGVEAAPVAAAANPDAVCAGCHRDLYDRYEQTPMARGSGPAMQGLLPGAFEHAASGVAYQVYARDGAGWMSYRRTGAAALAGERRLRFFVGSGHRGRTYLYQQDGLWFEAPINYYSRKGVWDMAPNFGASRTMPDGLPVDSNCLHCHATEVQPALPSARNRYADVPFLQGGVGCSACHGNTTQHAALAGHGAVVNPAKLDPGRRDSVCLQCHLEGNAAVYRAGRSLAEFRPGDDLADFVTYFVKAGAEAGGQRAASQYEALLRSRCKQASGDRLTCTTCHDPHGDPLPAERVSYYRGRCLSCHTGETIASKHHPEQQDCAACHMPTVATSDIAHEQLTDHEIRRTPKQAATPAAAGDAYRLVAVGAGKAGDREAGLAYAQAAEQGNRDALQQGLLLLRRAESAGANDEELHTQLGLLEQLAGASSDARKEYALALAEDANDNTALGNQAVLDAASGQAGEAVRLLERVVRNDPSQVAASLNLAFLECEAGDRQDALRVLQSLERFSPDDPTLRSFLHDGRYAGQRCAVSGR